MKGQIDLNLINSLKASFSGSPVSEKILSGNTCFSDILLLLFSDLMSFSQNSDTQLTSINTAPKNVRSEPMVKSSPSGDIEDLSHVNDINGMERDLALLFLNYLEQKLGVNEVSNMESELSVPIKYILDERFSFERLDYLLSKVKEDLLGVIAIESVRSTESERIDRIDVSKFSNDTDEWNNNQVLDNRFAEVDGELKLIKGSDRISKIDEYAFQNNNQIKGRVTFDLSFKPANMQGLREALDGAELQTRVSNPAQGDVNSGLKGNSGVLLLSEDEVLLIKDFLDRVERDFRQFIENFTQGASRQGFGGPKKFLRTALDAPSREGFHAEEASKPIDFTETANLPPHLGEGLRRSLSAPKKWLNGESPDQVLGARASEKGPFERILMSQPEGPADLPEEVIPLNMHNERVIYRVPMQDFLNYVRSFSQELLPHGERRARIQLEPPELGKLELEVSIKDGEVELRMRVERSETYAQLQQDLSQLKSQLEDLGLRVRDFQLTLSLSDERPFSQERGGEGSDERTRAGHGGRDEDTMTERTEPQIHHFGKLYRVV